MIYLFDDNRYEQMSQNYAIDYVAELKYHTASVKYFPSLNQADTEGDDFLSDADAVLIHDSFPDGDDYAKNNHKVQILDIANQKGIPYVVFSNQFTATVFDESNSNSIKTIKKDRFYANLIFFIEEFEINQKIKIEYLAIGKNYSIEKALIIEEELCSFLLEHSQKFFYDDHIKLGSESRNKLIELFKFKYDNEYTEHFLSFNENCSDNNIGAKDLKTEIKKIVNEILSKHAE